jgi:hypothetical protein
VLPARTSGPDLYELAARAQGVWRSTWAVFAWFNVAAPPWLYHFYTGLAAVGLVGLLILAARRLGQRHPSTLSSLAWLVLWVFVVVGGLLGCSQKRYPQGRLLFPALPAVAVLLAVGLAQMAAWISGRARRLAAAAPAASLFALAVWVPPGIIVPAYAALIPLVELPSRKLYFSQPHSPGGSARWATSCRRPPYSLATSYT